MRLTERAMGRVHGRAFSGECRGKLDDDELSTLNSPVMDLRPSVPVCIFSSYQWRKFGLMKLPLGSRLYAFYWTL